MERIQERSVGGSSEVFTEETAVDSVAMDCLTVDSVAMDCLAVDSVAMDCLAVPKTNSNTRQHRRMSPRQNSLPARTFQRIS